MDNGNDIPYTHVEIKDAETKDGKKQQFKVTITTNKFGFQTMTIQAIEKNMRLGVEIDRDGKEQEKRTWLRDWSNHK